jgi:ABC-type glycerol-3-phosphate transport system substrate-binding protein
MAGKVHFQRSTRRSFLAGLGAAAVLPILAACQQAPPTPQVVEKVVTQVVEKPVERVVTQVVEKPVEKVVTQVVEKQVVVQATPVPLKDRDTITFRAVGSYVEEHPWVKMADEYNASQGKVFVKIVVGTFSGGWWEWLGTLMAAGNPPDLFQLSVAGLYNHPGAAGDLPLVVDMAPFLSPEIKKETAIAQPSINLYGKTLLLPIQLDLGEGVAINTRLADQAGVDWKKIQKEGWTFDQFREAGMKLTRSTKGDGKTDQWGFGNGMEWFRGNLEENFGSAGVPVNSHAGCYNWGNKVDWNLPGFVEKMKMYAAMMQVDKSIPELVLGLPAISSGHELFFSQQVAMTHGYIGMPRAMIDWNNDIDKGKITGKKVDWQMALLPMPYLPPHKSVNIARANGITIFKQQPYKGDAHTKNVGEFVQWLAQPARVGEVANYEGWLPVYESLRKESKAMRDPVSRAFFDYTLPRASVYFPMGHPVSGPIRSDIWNNMFARVLKGEQQAEAALSQAANDAQVRIDTWVKESPELAKLWAAPPSADWYERYYTPGSAFASS